PLRTKRHGDCRPPRKRSPVKIIWKVDVTFEFLVCIRRDSGSLLQTNAFSVVPAKPSKGGPSIADLVSYVLRRWTSKRCSCTPDVPNNSIFRYRDSRRFWSMQRSG